MTNKEAIEILYKIRKRLLPSMKTEEESINLAIKVLKATNIIYEDGFSDGYSQRIAFEKNTGMLKEWYTWTITHLLSLISFYPLSYYCLYFLFLVS